jgi:hypothetical protein
MSFSAAWLRRFVFGIAPEEVSFARRGFQAGEDGIQQRLEQVGTTFLQGYHVALEVDDPQTLAYRLSGVAAEQRGFAFEGAAMSLALQDHFLPWRRNRWRAFLEGPGAAHTYMVHVGLGWAPARLPWRRWRFESGLTRLDPLLRWLAVEGYGFHEGYFHWPQNVRGQAVPKRLSRYGRRVFDQGLGRSLWFVNGADITRIAGTIRAFASSRRADLWSGVGLACGYAGGRERTALESLRQASGPYQPELAQGAAFAAKARQRAGNMAAHTELASMVLCRMTATEAAALTDEALADLAEGETEPGFEIWRRRLQAHFSVQASLGTAAVT